mmetsp:Transcript_4055/g.8855  ORF Transcript_4055/g.8855 Transcript_4055/m.8855 type:complete len:84 (+) Transcript_4055:297-548(+)
MKSTMKQLSSVAASKGRDNANKYKVLRKTHIFEKKATMLGTQKSDTLRHGEIDSLPPLIFFWRQSRFSVSSVEIHSFLKRKGD